MDATDTALFSAATRVQVNNGNKASFWSSSWLHGTSPATLFPRLHHHSKRKNRSVSEAINGNTWIRDIAHHLTQPIIADYFKLWSMIDQMQLQLLDNNEEDTITWTATASGE